MLERLIAASCRAIMRVKYKVECKQLARIKLQDIGLQTKDIHNIDDFYNWAALKSGGSTAAALFKTFSDTWFAQNGARNFIKFFFKILPVRKLWFNRQRSVARMLGFSYYDFAKDVLEHEAEYRWLYSSFADDESRRVLLNVLLYKVTLNRNFLKSLARHTIDQYFDPEIFRFTENEVIADCGAFSGDSALLFFRLFKTCSRYYLFEPDPANMLVAKRTLSACSYIDFLQYATSSGSRAEAFSIKGPSGRLQTSGSMQVAVTSLDEAVKDDLTFIKMDIEGSEAETLDGAKLQIGKNKPKLAVCAYHKPDDAWQLARKILHLRPDYRLRFRLYHSAYCETVIYAD